METYDERGQRRIVAGAILAKRVGGTKSKGILKVAQPRVVVWRALSCSRIWRFELPCPPTNESDLPFLVS